MVKLLMSWDIKPGRESEYFEFVVRDYAPSMIRLGIQPTEAWYTIYGDGPQMFDRRSGRRHGLDDGNLERRGLGQNCEPA